jgi:hypothetical protein
MNEAPAQLFRQELPRSNLCDLAPLTLVIHKIFSCSFTTRHVSVGQVRYIVVPSYAAPLYRSNGTIFRRTCTCPTKEPITLTYEVKDPSYVIHKQPQSPQALTHMLV